MKYIGKRPSEGEPADGFAVGAHVRVRSCKPRDLLPIADARANSANLDVRGHRENAIAQLLLKAVHHRDHHDQRGDAERDAGHRYRGDERYEAIAARTAARAKITQADNDFVGDQQRPCG